ncbi:unnamed protein product [Albugo candida]|uniref:DUF4833 domain-containing protein n=1 Tax=Albugo candida TaxID=65357 RepID=A0A024FWU3_9STRA|nr:unnamed protein product [Albugo candida]|eukprot:CCI11392.1 unnamed protein product [Albugo candida]
MATDFSKPENNPFPYIRDKHEKYAAFVIHRNKNANVVVYSLRIKEDGVIVEEDALDVYWVMFEKSGHPKEKLNMIEKNTGYGASCAKKEGRDGEYEIIVTSIKDKRITLSLEDGKAVARGTFNDIENCILERVFVSSKSVMGLPKVQYVEFFGTCPDGSPFTERKTA